MSVDDEASVFEFIVEQIDANERLDALLTRLLQSELDESGVLPGIDVVPTRSKVARWIDEGYLQLNFERCRKSSIKPSHGDKLHLCVPPAEAINLEPDSSVAFEIVFEDEALLVIDKPAGLVVHPGAGQQEGTLVHGLLAHLGDELRSVGDALRPGTVHRLDKDTSGLMLVAKSDVAYQKLAAQFLPPRSVHRTYQAIVVGAPRSAERNATQGRISEPIGRHPKHRKKMAVVEGGREACTRWKILERFSLGSRLEVELETGRTHQIRVHLQHLNSPIVGDLVYGPGDRQLPAKLRAAAKSLGRQALHASRLAFLHPSSAEECCFDSALPEDIERMLSILRNANG